VWRVIPAAVGLLVGVVLLLGGVLGGVGPERGAMEVAALVSGVYLATASFVSIGGEFRMAWRLRRSWLTQGAELRAWRVERIGPVAAAEVERASARQRALLVGPFVVTSVLILVVRIGSSDPDVAAVIVAVVVLAGLVTGLVFLVRRRRRRAAAPAEHDFTAVPPT
jgi:hypothetical protein